MPINTYNLPFEKKEKDDENETTDENFGFDFPLSDFQKHAIDGLLHGHHVLVCAPTGSGKTLPAEFAIRHFILHLHKKVVYTSPIKALSNQKFHEFSRKFPDISVGLCTGDIKTNPSAQLLLVTAEILNNAIFLSHNHETNSTPSSSVLQLDIDNDLGCVIMDEVHYINDADRGHVWEQTIMTLPAHIQMLMLSATLDGPLRFASWIETTKGTAGTNPQKKEKEENQQQKQTQKQVVLAGTNHRIVPLTHYVFLPTTEAALKTIGTKSTVQQIRSVSNRLLTIKSPNMGLDDATFNSMDFVLRVYKENRVRINRQHTLNSLATFMKGQQDPDVDDCLLPAIVFVFSRRQVEEAAAEITQSMWPFDAKEPYTIAHTCEQFLRSKLANYREYLALPEYQRLIALLEKGVGIHHSGMIPVLREVVELLIAQKSIRLLFATESFAIGLDCPIRTAVFTGLQKPDGSSSSFAGFRTLFAHEYTQMAGRAGRRGIDVVGNAILLPTLFKDGSITREQWKQVLSNTPQRLESKFQMDYRMVLSLLKKGQRNRFHEFAQQSMMMEVWTSYIKKQRATVEELETALEQKERHISTCLRTSEAACLSYLDWMEKREKTVNKKRKEAERAMQTLENEHRFIKEDAKSFQQVAQLRDKVAAEIKTLRGMEMHMETEVQQIVSVLEKGGFICLSKVASPLRSESSETEYYLTDKGEMASRLAESHPLVMTDFLFSLVRFGDIRFQDDALARPEGAGTMDLSKEMSPKTWIQILSSCCNIRVNENNNAGGDGEPSSPLSQSQHEQPSSKQCIHVLQTLLEKYMDEERDKQLYISSKESDFHDDLVEYVGPWIDATEETACRLVLQSLEREKGVSAGDFVKVILKICALAREIGSACTDLGFVQIAHDLSLVDSLMLKYVATSQSLYL